MSLQRMNLPSPAVFIEAATASVAGAAPALASACIKSCLMNHRSVVAFRRLYQVNFARKRLMDAAYKLKYYVSSYGGELEENYAGQLEQFQLSNHA